MGSKGPDSGDPGRQSKKIGFYLRHSQLGLQLFLSIGLATGLGLWLDSRYDTGALFTLLGALFGFSAGFYSVYVDLFPPARGSRGAAGGEGGAGSTRGRRGGGDPADDGDPKGDDERVDDENGPEDDAPRAS